MKSCNLLILAITSFGVTLIIPCFLYSNVSGLLCSLWTHLACHSAHLCSISVYKFEDYLLAV